MQPCEREYLKASLNRMFREAGRLPAAFQLEYCRGFLTQTLRGLDTVLPHFEKENKKV